MTDKELERILTRGRSDNKAEDVRLEFNGFGATGNRVSVGGDESVSVSEIALVQLGIGTVGRELIRKVKGWNDAETSGLNYRYLGFADRSGFAFDKTGFSSSKVGDVVAGKENGKELEEIYPRKVESINSIGTLLEEVDKGILVDVTDAGAFLDVYGEAFDNGWKVVLANKIPLTEVEPEGFNKFKESGLRYEATVGAGLPVISTLDHLKDHGEKFKEIAAILSGSLSFILSRVEEGAGLKQAVQEAKEKGFTEPNPAEDLLGNDVARKSVILGRSAGLDFSLEDISLEPLVSLSKKNLTWKKLKDELDEANDAFQDRVKSAKSRGNRLRYIARINKEGATVGLEEVDKDGPLGRGNTANVVLFRTSNYDDPPLIVKGPGAGPRVTAGGIFSDINNCRIS